MSDTSLKELIPQEAYREFQSVVGSENATIDPVHCQAYTGRGYAREQWWFTGFSTRPACVLLPQTTEEVAKIVRICNRYKIPYLPASTLWGIGACPRFRDDFVTIDLKRMDKLEIDEKNMYAVLGPAVIYGQLIEEAMQRDLYTVVPGGGSQAGVIANHLVYGMSPLGYRVGISERRMNAAEWVTPEGEIVRLGSRVVGDDSWYWQDGIGPNAMGILRGYVGWFGAMGIVTKMSVKLYPFQPERLEPEGITPETRVKLPPRMRFYNFTMPSREALEKGIYEISKAQIGAIVQKVPFFWRVIARVKDRNDFWEQWEKVTPEEIANTHILRVLLIGYTSQKQLEYEERVLMDIMNELGGNLRRTRQTDQSLLKFADSAGMWMMTGGYMSHIAGIESIRCGIEVGKLLGKKHAEYAPPLMAEYGDPGWIQSTEFGHQSYAESLSYLDVDKLDMESPKFSKEVMTRVFQWYMSETPQAEMKAGFHNWFHGEHVPLRLIAPAWHNFDVWVDRFKQEFDSQEVCNPSVPYQTDELAERHPEFITAEVKEAVAKMAQELTRGGNKRGPRRE